jgi:antitoxin HigA-1
MTQMIRIQGSTTPPTPGQVLQEKLLDGMHVTQAELARAIDISRPRLNMILKGRCPISPEIALRLAQVSGIAAHFWMRVRAEYELHQEVQRLAGALETLPALRPASAAQATAWVVEDWRAAA